MPLNQDFYIDVKRIDDALISDSISLDSIRSVMELINKDKDLRSYFFKRVESIQWFDYLKNKKYFNVTNILFDRNNNAYFWDILEYIEKVSEQVAENTQYGKELIDIINNLVQFSLTNKRINNYHIWWYCVKILNNLPPAVIRNHLPSTKFQAWLSVWTARSQENDLTISDISQKLLPKFLADDFSPDFAHAEVIISAITAIKAGGKQRSLTDREDAGLVWHSYWILDTFKKYSQVIGQKCSIRVVHEIADKLSKALIYKQKDHYVDLEIGPAVYRIKVTRLFADGLELGEIKFKENEYECIVKLFSEEQLKNIDRMKDLWAFHNLDPQQEITHFTFSALTRDLFISEIKKNLLATVTWHGAGNLEQKILAIYTGLYSDYSHVWCRSLKDGPEFTEDADSVLTIILRDVLVSKCETNKDQGKEVLNSFLELSKYQFPIFRRFVLICADKFWTEYSDFLNKIIDVIPTVLEESDLEVEVYDMLRNHNAEFDTPLKEKLKTLIANVPQYYLDKGDEKLGAHWKYKWLLPLRENPDFSSLYEETKHIVQPKDGQQYGVDRSGFTGGFVAHKSPIAKEQLLKDPVGEIVKYLSDFKGTDFWHGSFEGEPDKEGLSSTLQAAVKDDPGKFTDELDAFISADYYYLNSMFRGLRDAWNAGTEISWKDIFDFIIKYFSKDKDIILSEALNAQGNDSGKGRYMWLIESIVDLISDASKNDLRLFPQEYFSDVEQIFDLIIPLLEGEKHPDTQRDALTYALNTTLGRTIMAYISFSLRVKRTPGKKTAQWGHDKFDRFLPIGIDGYIWFGCYLPQMKYLDDKYVIKTIDSLSKKNSTDFEWQMFMEGYLTGSSVSLDLYKLMRLNYKKAIESTVFKGRAAIRLVQHICIGYLRSVEALAQNNEDGELSLFWKLLNEIDSDDKKDRWKDVAGFFWSIERRNQKDSEGKGQKDHSQGFKDKVLAFWEWTVKEQNLIKSKLGDEYHLFLSRMSELTIWLDKIDKNTQEWLMLCAPHIELEHRSTFFIEYLARFEDEESIRHAGQIFLKVLEKVTPTFKKEDIQSIVERLYKIGEKDPAVKTNADEICNTYGRCGLHFLRPLWEKFNR